MPLHLFISLVFLLNFIILFFIRPIGGENFNSTDMNQSQIPQIIFKDFTLFDIGKNNIVGTTLSGERGEGFRDGSYRIRNVEIKYQNSEFIENIVGKYAYYNSHNIEIQDNVFYKRSDNRSIKTDKLSYNIENGYVFIPNNFIFQKDGFSIKGNHLVIDRDKGKISAFKIDAILK